MAAGRSAAGALASDLEATIDATPYKTPFPWFGGKSRAAQLVWDALGDVQNYVEPFFGSGAVLFMRPSEHTGYVETVNDYDGYVANFWRAVKAAPDEVAEWADNPVNENDLTARHIWLVQHKEERLARLEGDPDYYDAKVAGWWVWGICCWIGGGWCSGQGPWTSIDGQLVHLGNPGQGVNRQRVHLGNAGQGVNRNRVHLGDAGQGVNRKRVHLGNAGRGVNRPVDAADSGTDTGLAELTAYMRGIATRLRYVRVCCGDWSRVVTVGALSRGSTVGVFLDPPYDTTMREKGCYNSDATDDGISAAAREWAIANGDDPRFRIVLAGYDGEHEMPATWRVVEWKARPSYQTHTSKNNGGGNSENRHKERLWLSPHCLGQHGQTVVQPALMRAAQSVTVSQLSQPALRVCADRALTQVAPCDWGCNET